MGFVAIAVACLLLGVFFACSCFQGTVPGQMVFSGEKINPNTAPAASITRLQGIGPKRAEAIVKYREKMIQKGQAKVFSSCDDLQQIKGIGQKTVEKLCQWLTFN